MSAFWIGVWASVIGAVVGSGLIGGVVVFWQTRVTNRAAEVQAGLLRSSAEAWAVVAQNRTAAYQFHLVIAELLAALEAVQDSVLRQLRDPQEAVTSATVRRAAYERVGRYILCEHGLLVAALPELQRSWLENIDQLTSELDPPANSSRETLIRLNDELKEDIGWLWWALEVLVTVVAGTTEPPPEPDQRVTHAPTEAAVEHSQLDPSAGLALSR